MFGNKPVIIIWDVIKHIQVRQLFGHTNDIECLRVLPNGNLISSSDDKTIRIWDTTNGQMLKEWKGKMMTKCRWHLAFFIKILSDNDKI